MQLFPLGRTYDFMGKRRFFAGLSAVVILAALALLFVKGPRLGTDFLGGTEIEVAFLEDTTPAQIREAVQKSGLSRPDVVPVEDDAHPHRFMVRIQEVSTISEEKQGEVENAVCYGEGLPEDTCPVAKQAAEVKFSPGGDKITVRFREPPDLAWLKQRMDSISGIQLRPGDNNPSIQNARDNKVEIQLSSKGDQLMSALREHLGEAKVPESPLRAEWIGPRAGAQLRDSAIKSIVIALIFIMAYIAFRFDLRFAPGAVVALAHDATATLGILVILNREINLTTIAAVLTIIGYSVNDTVVVYDRVRENLGKLRGATFLSLINVSLSEMLSRTILTSGTTIISLLAFFVWGTGTLKDFALTLIIGLIFGTYSSIYVALPLTHTLDRLLFSKVAKAKSKPDKAGAKATATT
jgi:preprotein translocase subunit SecF